MQKIGLNILITVFIFINIVLLIGGYYLVNDALAVKGFLSVETEQYQRKEQELLAQVDILKQSNEDVYANIKVLHEETVALQEDITTYEGSNPQQNANLYAQQVAAANQRTANLNAKISSTQKTIATQKAAAAAAVRRTTRSS